MKLIIQIPCYNEAGTLAIALADLPREVEGFSVVEWLIIDDGSRDDTVEVAKANGVDHVVSHQSNKGLAVGFMTGLNACLERGADVIVNTDADNQYNAADIPLLVRPIVERNSDIVIGERPIQSIQHFSLMKKMLQKLGSWVVRVASGTDIPDAPSGFRAISRDAAMRLMVYSSYTYTLETIIQAGRKNISISSVPIRVKEDLRPSRLVKSIRSYVQRSMGTIFRIFAIYKPFRFFSSIGIFLMSIGLLLWFRFLYFYMIGNGGGHVQSVVAGGVFAGMGFQTILMAFVADILAANRILLEDVRYRQLKSQFDREGE